MKLNLSVKIQKVKTCLLVQKPESWVCTLKVLPSQIITLIMAEIEGYFAYLLLNISKVSKNLLYCKRNSSSAIPVLVLKGTQARSICRPILCKLLLENVSFNN